MKIQVIYKETIKPSSPTPHHLRNLSLSVFDQPFQDIYVPLLLFYPNDNNKYFEGKHSLILNKPELVILKQLLPTVLDSSQADIGCLLLVKANFFECAIARGSNNTTDHIELLDKFGVAASLFPQVDFLNSLQPALEFPQEKCTTKRFVFDASKIAALKSKAGSATMENLTRVEYLRSLEVHNGIIKSKFGFVRPYAWCQAVNIRKILVRPSVENLLGNLVTSFPVKAKESEVDHDLQSLVAKLRKGIDEFKVKYTNGVSADDECEIFKEYMNLLARNDIETYSGSSCSWCKFPFYEANFGWQQLSWLRIRSSHEFKNAIIYMDTSDGVGVEASLIFTERRHGHN
ncbi:BAHD acyltransferase [Pyrus ussuriensis x Pyrus communis]|uniref:BAHD acyltransferase n=1 Tax=Pyrus ussuriensis x Pyrus communis TaxID=2448454 RepID=A0A5N5IPH9_9ROSA|nr:BAHD acyltransferase [Pyrus ussuriensis x Pyrus communis]